ncbi:MAG: hypothetical protein MUF56_06850 [Solirubrobacteraceae bacterium]|nr:hypothetical protein [Solirubrobacteraceae bacterium]
MKNSVPANWIDAAHQSLQPSLRQPPAVQRPVRRSWMNAAAVKKTEPIAYVALSAPRPTSAA